MPLEHYVDRIESRPYDLWRCKHCSLEYAWPFVQATASWYQRSGLQDYSPISPRQRWIKHDIFFGFHLPGKRVLDVGCGNGKFVIDLIRHGYDAEGVDFDAEIIAQARASGVNNVRVADFRAPAADPSTHYDVVSAIEVIEHVDDLNGFMHFLSRMVKPGGHLYLTTPNRRRPIFWWREFGDYPPHHLTHWDLDCLNRFVERYGFRFVTAYTSDFPIRHFFNMLFYPLMKSQLLVLLLRPFRSVSPVAPTTSRERTESAAPSQDGKWLTRLKTLKIGKMISRFLSLYEMILFLLTLPVTGLVYFYYRWRKPKDGIFIAALYQKAAA